MTSHVPLTDQATHPVASEDIPGGQKPRHTRGSSVKRKSDDEVEQQEERKKISFDSFFNFCSFVLAYEQQLASLNGHPPPQASLNGHPPLQTTPNGYPDPNLNSMGHPTMSSHTSADHPNMSSLNSAGESSYSTSPNSTHTSGEDSGDDDITRSPPSPSEAESKLEYTSDDESWNIVTCFCRRPFAGRPMIECSKCQTWIHLYCAKIKKDQVPDIYTCPKCRSSGSKKDRPQKSL